MNCPSCKTKIGENDLVCPECKKVLRLKCHACGALTRNASCEKCGTVLVNKCYKCSKLNSTTLENCPQCGLNINASIGLRESLIEEFAVLTIEIKNFEDIKTAFKSDKITEQFKENLYALIKRLALQKKLRVQFLNDTFIIRFCKDYSFNESCRSAIDFSIYVAQSVTEINQKLFDAKGVAIKAQMAVQKRDVYAKPQDYKSGLHINVVYSSNIPSHLFNNVEVIVDSYVYQEVKVKYPLQSLSAVFVKNKMVMFFELILHKLIKLEKEEQTDENIIRLPKNLDYEPEEYADDESLINFSSLNCSFLKTSEEGLLGKLEEIAEQGVENPIVAICGNKKSSKLALTSTEDLSAIWEGHKIVRFSCPKDNKFTPYGIFRQILLAYRNVSETEITLNPEAVEAVTQDENLKNLLLMAPDGQTHPEDIRFTYFEAFSHFIKMIPFKTLFVIEDFENADESSIEIIKDLFENKELGDTGFLVSCDENFGLHRKIHKLMTSNNYFEIQLKPSSNKNIAALNAKSLKNLKDSFYFEKVLENTRGSHFYFNQALAYLEDDKILAKKDGKYIVTSQKMLVLPKKIDELFEKRLFHLKHEKGAHELFASMVLMGEKLPYGAVLALGISDDKKVLAYLQKRGFIEFSQEKDILVKHRNLFKTALLESVEAETLTQIAMNLLEKIYSKTPATSAAKAELLEIAKLKKEAFSQWHAMAMLSSQSGDFCAYLNCTNKFLSLVDNVIDKDTNTTVEQVKMEVYGELASMLYKYYPDKIINFLEMLLENLEKQNDDKRIKEVANKLVQSCLISGNFHNALEYIGKILSRTPRSSFDPKDKGFSLNYFLLNLVTLEIYFNLARLNECIDLGEELFRHVDLSTITESVLPEGFSKKQFDDAILDALFFVNVSRLIQLKKDRKEKLQAVIEKLPQNYACFRLLALLSDFLEGKDIIEPMKEIARGGLNDKYSKILFPTLQALISLQYQDWNNVGNYIYNAKIEANSLHFHQIELFCELLIAYAYENLGSAKKAKQIYCNVTDISSDKGLKNITAMSWYLNAKSELSQGNFEVASSIANNAIVSIENDENASAMLVMMFKALSAQLSLHSGNLEQALFYAEQAFETALKNGINLALPQIADILAYIYNQILESPQPKEVLTVYEKKMAELEAKMAAL